MNLAGAKVSLVNSICVPHDAISSSLAETARALEQATPGNVALYTYRCDLPGLPSRPVSGVGELLRDPHFLASDLLLFHFGIHYPLFDALIAGNGRARRVARFHNVTPREFVPRASWPTIDRSLEQMENLAWADHVWCDSEFNRRFLVDFGLPPDRLSTLELPVEVSAEPPAQKAAGAAPVLFLYLGRVVASKGVHDLVRAVASLRRRGLSGFRVLVAGNEDFSDRDFSRGVHRQVEEGGLRDFVSFCGEVSEAEKARLLDAADALVIPSYHEGFCMPVVEALGRGLFVIGYAAGNTPFVAGGFCRLVAPGDSAALAEAMAAHLTALRSESDPWLDTDGQGRLRRSAFRAGAHAYACRFSPAKFRTRLLDAIAAQPTH